MSPRKRVEAKNRDTGEELEAEILEGLEQERAQKGKAPGPGEPAETPQPAQAGAPKKASPKRPKKRRKVRVPRKMVHKLAEAPLFVITKGASFAGRVPVFDKEWLPELHDSFEEMVGITELEIPPWAAYLGAVAVIAATASYLTFEEAQAATASGAAQRRTMTEDDDGKGDKHQPGSRAEPAGEPAPGPGGEERPGGGRPPPAQVVQ